MCALAGLLLFAAWAHGTEVGPSKGFNQTVTFDNYNSGTSYSIRATPQTGWRFVDEDTASHNNWELGAHSVSAANASITVDDKLGSPDFFGLALDGYMVTDEDEGKKVYWSITAGIFYIHSGEEYVKVISGWGDDITFSAKGGENPVSWTVVKNDPGEGNIPDTLPDGRTLTIGKIGNDGENPVAPGEYTVSATDANDKTDEMLWIVLRADLDVDSNNDGVIDDHNDGEDEYEEYAPGVIVCVNREGDKMSDHLVQLKIRPLPDSVNDGTLTLGIPQGFANITVWKDASKTERIGLPKTYDVASDTIPGTLYIDGNRAGNAVIDLTYQNIAGVEVGKDTVAVHVTDTISWSPDINHAQFWEPCEWANYVKGYLPSYPGDTIFNGIKDQGWGTMVKRFKPPTSFPIIGSHFGNLSLSNFKGMDFSGFVCVYTHGKPGYICAVYAYDPRSIAISGLGSKITWKYA